MANVFNCSVIELPKVHNRSGNITVVDHIDEILPFDEMSRLYLQAVLGRTGGRIYGKGGAAELLDMKPTTLQSKIKKLGVR